MNKRYLKRGVLAAILVVLISVSLYITSVPPASAAIYYVVGYPYMPADLQADVNNDGNVTVRDLVSLALAYGSTNGSQKWDPRCDFNNDGKVSLGDLVLLVVNYGRQEGYPYAYSTSFNFTVPNDGDNEVHYYVLTRIYVPQTLDRQAFNFTPTHMDDWVNNMKIDGNGKYAVPTPPDCQLTNVSLGSLTKGYHLLQFEFVEEGGDGGLTFSVTTPAGDCAWLVRFRIYVPNYSSTMIGYGVTTYTNFADADFILSGYADKSIDSVSTSWSGGPHWSGWMWDAGPGGAIYGWGDGFLYPLSTPGVGSHTVGFTFKNYEAGLLDFQYLSLKYQPDRIGWPKFYASASPLSNLGSGITPNNANLCAGSLWSGDPGISDRNATLLATYNVSGNAGDDWFNALYEIELGNWLAPWELGAQGQHTDFAIPLNFTVADFTSSSRFGVTGFPPYAIAYYWNIYLKNYTLDVYSFQDLHIDGSIEENEDQSLGIVNSNSIIELNFAGTSIMTATAFIEEYGIPYVGAFVGLGITGMAAYFDWTQGQLVSQYNSTIQQNNHLQLTANNPIELVVDTNGTTKSKSDLIFLKLHMNNGWRCGLTEIFLNGTLGAEYNIVPSDDWPVSYDYPLGVINMTLCIPWFIWSLT